MTDILADIDDTLADWHGSADSMRWKPEGDGVDKPLASTMVTLTASAEGAVTGFRRLADALLSPAPMWFDRQGRPIDSRTANSLLGDRGYKRVALTRIRSRADSSVDWYVSTVWLGVNHAFLGGPPILFETMVFGESIDETQWRWTTESAAVAGHEDIVVRLGGGVRRVRVENCDRFYGPSVLDARYHQRQRNRRKRRR